MPWDRELKQHVTDDPRTFVVGLSDDAGAGANVGYASKVRYRPTQVEVDKLNDYIEHTLWGGQPDGVGVRHSLARAQPPLPLPTRSRSPFPFPFPFPSSSSPPPPPPPSLFATRWWYIYFVLTRAPLIPAWIKDSSVVARSIYFWGEIVHVLVGHFKRD